MADADKRTECVRVCMSERMFLDLNHEAIRADRSLPEFIYLIVRNWKYGHGMPVPGSTKEQERGSDVQ